MEIDNKIKVMQGEGDNPVPATSDAPPSPHASSIDHEQEQELDETAPVSRDLGAEQGTEQTYYGSQPQACSVCGKNFAFAYRLRRHMICHEESPQLRRFRCPDCQKAFKFKHHLKVAMTTLSSSHFLFIIT
jgi:hypothetical protein